MKNSEKYKTAQERAEAFFRYCENRDCEKCDLNEMRSEVTRQNDHVCLAFWLDLEAAEDEEPLPCPFCGEGVMVVKDEDGNWIVSCISCLYTSGGEGRDRHGVIAAHNRVAKKCREGKE